MEYQAAFENHVRTRLESSFGKAVAMLIVASASNASGANTMGMDQDAYHKMCSAITSDQRVVDMWGASGAQEAFKQWSSVAR